MFYLLPNLPYVKDCRIVSRLCYVWLCIYNIKAATQGFTASYESLSFDLIISNDFYNTIKC